MRWRELSSPPLRHKFSVLMHRMKDLIIKACQRQNKHLVTFTTLSPYQFWGLNEFIQMIHFKYLFSNRMIIWRQNHLIVPNTKNWASSLIHARLKKNNLTRFFSFPFKVIWHEKLWLLILIKVSIHFTTLNFYLICLGMQNWISRTKPIIIIS